MRRARVWSAPVSLARGLMAAALMTDDDVAAGLKIDLATRRAMRAQAGLMASVNQVPGPAQTRSVELATGSPPASEPRALVCRAA